MGCRIIGGWGEGDIDFIWKQVKEWTYVICGEKGYEYGKKGGGKGKVIVGDFDW